MKTPLAALTLALLLGSAPALAGRRPHLDARSAAPAKPAPAARVTTGAPPAFVASVDDKRGVPTFLWAALPASGAPSLRALGPEAAARLHLEAQAGRYGLGPEALATAELTRVHDVGRGGVLAVFHQRSQGVPLFHTELKVLMRRDLTLVAMGGNLHAAAAPARKGAAFTLDERKALAAAFEDLYGLPVPPASFLDTKRRKADYRYFDLLPTPVITAKKLRLTAPARVKKVLFPLPDRLVPAYFLELLAGPSDGTDADVYAYVISAATGQVLYREDLTHADTFQYRVWASPAGDKRPFDGPLADFNPHPTGSPDGSYPPFAAPSLVSIDGFNKNPQNQGDPWLPAGAAVSTGNNVDAYTDDDAPDGFSNGDIRATPTAPGVFDRVYNVNAGPQSSQGQKMASVTELFYVNNWLHDWWYDSGFDEAAGNAQQDNFGRGGIGGDALRAEAQDGAPDKRNNADMAVVGDGESPRMQMYVWDPPPGVNVDRDGTLDNSVVAHEWGHYLHLRLVACGSAFCSAESEGWADFVALMLTLRPGDKPDGAYGIAHYATAAFPEPGYFGIRRYPYSTDMTKSPLTFRHIQAGESLPPNVPSSVLSDDNAESHNAGEVWAAMLFEGYMAMRAKAESPNPPYSIVEAQRRMGDYVVTGMQLAPADPTFLEQRDAVLAAAAAADLGDLATLAQGFAKRGAGSCAVSPPRESQDFVGVVESFEVKPSLSILEVSLDDSLVSCDQDGVLDAGESGQVKVLVMNTGPAQLSAGTVFLSSGNAAVSFPGGANIPLPALPPFGSAEVTVPIALSAAIVQKTKLALHLTGQVPAGCAAVKALDVAPFVHYDLLLASSSSDDVEAPSSAWSPSGVDQAKIWSRVQPNVGNHAWQGIDYGVPSDTALVSPPLQVAVGQSFVIGWKQRYRFETSMGVFWDGGVIELSDDGGANWHDVSDYANPGYTGTIGDPDNQAQNVLKDRQGFVDQSIGYPGLEGKSVDLGAQLAGKTVRVRFRIGTDDAVGDFGWEIDDLSFSGITNTPFASLAPNVMSCGGTTSSSSGGGGGAGGNGGAGGMGVGGMGVGGMGVGGMGVGGMGVGGMGVGGATSGVGGGGATTVGTDVGVGAGPGGVGVTTGGEGGGGGGQREPIAFGGCGCGASGEAPSAPGGLALLGLGALFLRRRRLGSDTVS